MQTKAVINFIAFFIFLALFKPITLLCGVGCIVEVRSSDTALLKV